MAKGTVKWFNRTKGFGFIRPDGGDRDVFVHISDVQRASLVTLSEGQELSYETAVRKGKTSAVDLTFSGAIIPSDSGEGSGDEDSSARQTGTVSWYEDSKGFGFIGPDAGGRDVFVHKTAVGRSGLGTLKEGDRISYVIGGSGAKTWAQNLERA